MQFIGLSYLYHDKLWYCCCCDTVLTALSQ